MQQSSLAREALHATLPHLVLLVEKIHNGFGISKMFTVWPPELVVSQAFAVTALRVMQSFAMAGLVVAVLNADTVVHVVPARHKKVQHACYKQ